MTHIHVKLAMWSCRDEWNYSDFIPAAALVAALVAKEEIKDQLKSDINFLHNVIERLYKYLEGIAVLRLRPMISMLLIIIGIYLVITNSIFN